MRDPKRGNPVPLSRPTKTLLAVLVFAIVFVTFLPALKCDFVDWDDTDNFIRNEHYRGLGPQQLHWMFTTFHMGHYQPLAWVTLGMDYTWGRALLAPHPEYGPGMNPLSYHLTNVVIHGANAVLVLFLSWILLGLAGSPGADRKWALPAAAAFSALLFGIHPLRVESVAWITQRRDLLSAFFYLLTVLIYLHAQTGRGPRRRTWMVAAFGVFILCNLSKVIGITLPLVFLVLDVYPLRRFARVGGGAPRETTGWILLEKAPFLLVALVFGVIASRGQAGMGATMPLSMHPVSGRIGVIAYGLVFYVRKSLAPFGLVPIYELHLPVRLSEPRFALSLLALAVVLVGLLLVRKRAPGLVAAAVVYAILILPVSGIVQNGWQLAHDRYGYLACIGLGIAAAGGLLRIEDRFRGRALGKAIPPVGAALLVLLGAASWRQCRVWRDTAALWTHAVRYAPGSSFAQNGYGYVLEEQGRYAEAEVHFHRAIAIQPTNEKALENLYNVLLKEHKNEEAITVCRTAIETGRNPADWQYRLGFGQTAAGRAEDGIESYRRAVEIRPDLWAAQYNLAIALAGTGDIDGAIDHYEAAIRADPKMNAARLNLALIYERRGDLESAARILREALRIEPGYAKARRALDQIQARSGGATGSPGTP